MENIFFIFLGVLVSLGMMAMGMALINYAIETVRSAKRDWDRMK